MKKFVPALLLIVASMSVAVLNAQTSGPTVCPISAGADQTICAPNCATVTGTYVASNLPGTAANAYVSSTIPYAPDPFNVGTPLALADDQWSGVIALPFPFCYYGNTYTQCLIGSNGLLTFNVGTPSGYCPWPIPATNAPSGTYGWSNAIGGPWQDLYPPAGGSIRYTTYGTAPCRRFVVSWNQLPMYSCTSTLLTQQIILYETTNVIDNFIQVRSNCSWNGGRAIQCVMNNGGTQAVVVAGRNALNAGWTTTNDGKRYTPNGASNVVVGWYQGATLISSSVSTSVCPTSTTTYTFQATYTNCNGTTVTVSDQMIVTSSGLIVNATPASQTICNGGSANLSATAAGAVSWQWNIIPSGTLVGTSQNITVSPTTTTTYVVTATDASGCQGFDTVTVNVTALTTQDAGPNDTVCSGSCATLTATGGVSYLWSADPSISGPLNGASVSACPTVTTQYTVTVTDASGCQGTDSVTVFVAPTILSVSALGTNVTCFGACDGTGSASASGGYAPYSYSWSNSMTGPNISNLCAGPYTVTATDAVGCIATANINVTEPTALDVQATSITTANCGQNDGSVTISITGGVPGPGYIISWPSGGSGLTEINLPPGQVCVTVTDANGCDTTVCFNVPNTPGATAAITSYTNVSCFAQCDGDATGSGAGGTPPYNFSWSTTPAQLTPTAVNLCPGTYTVTMTDSNGCTDTAQVTITEPPLLTVTVGTPTVICIGQSANLTSQGNGGTPTYSYGWTDGVNFWTTQNITVSPTVTTTYSCVATDANVCTSAPQSVTVTVNPPLSVNASNMAVVCQGSQVNLSAVGAGGDGNYTYTWTPGPITGANITITANSTQIYTVTLTDGCGTPSAQDTVSVVINPAPIPTFNTTTPTQGCEDLCVTFQNTTPNTASVVWTFDNLGSSTSSPASFCFNDAGQYDITLTVTDVIGCTGTTTMNNYVDVWPLPVADFTASPQPATALNNIVQFSDLSVGAVSWIWSFGEDDSASVLQNPTYIFQDTGVYMTTLYITNSYGCRDSITLPIVVQEDYALYIPNTFTPNGDGHNDVFFPQGIGVDPMNYTMYIFDRWGNMIYQTSTWPGGWDGTVQGSGTVCQIDTYVYKITTKDPNGSRRVYIGHINLIR